MRIVLVVFITVAVHVVAELAVTAVRSILGHRHNGLER
jgi:hypothetical protein